MRQPDLYFKIVPFSKQTIEQNKLHLVYEDELGGSTIRLILERVIPAQFPRQMAVCLANGLPVGVGVVFLVKPADTCLSQDDEYDHEVHGFVNIYVKREFRCRGIGARLIDMSIKNFKSTYPTITRVLVSHFLKDRFRMFRGIVPIFANTRKQITANFFKKVGKRYRVREISSTMDRFDLMSNVDQAS